MTNANIQQTEFVQLLSSQNVRLSIVEENPTITLSGVDSRKWPFGSMPITADNILPGEKRNIDCVKMPSQFLNVLWHAVVSDGTHSVKKTIDVFRKSGSQPEWSIYGTLGDVLDISFVFSATLTSPDEVCFSVTNTGVLPLNLRATKLGVFS